MAITWQVSQKLSTQQWSVNCYGYSIETIHHNKSSNILLSLIIEYFTLDCGFSVACLMHELELKWKKKIASHAHNKDKIYLGKTQYEKNAGWSWGLCFTIFCSIICNANT